MDYENVMPLLYFVFALFLALAALPSSRGRKAQVKAFEEIHKGYQPVVTV
jgi:hypothetical protein